MGSYHQEEAEEEGIMQSKYLRVTTLALPKIAVRQLDALAVLEGRTRSALAREAIADLLRRRAAARAETAETPAS
jgi:predicted transcriptional regulator